MELIKITEQNGKQAVSGRDLHYFLDIETRFDIWIKRMLEYGFDEFRDYETCTFLNTQNQQVIDYAITLECAKEISMIQRSEKGKRAREYFIQCEKKLLQVSQFKIPQTFSEALRLASEQAEKIELQTIELKKQAPMVDYYQDVLKSNKTYNTNLIAKELGMSAQTLNRKLQVLKIQYKQNGVWVLYHKYQDKGYTKTNTVTITDSNGNTSTRMQTVWTEKGREFIHSVIKHQTVLSI